MGLQNSFRLRPPLEDGGRGRDVSRTGRVDENAGAGIDRLEKPRDRVRMLLRPDVDGDLLGGLGGRRSHLGLVVAVLVRNGQRQRRREVGIRTRAPGINSHVGLTPRFVDSLSFEKSEKSENRVPPTTTTQTMKNFSSVILFFKFRSFRKNRQRPS